MTLELLKWSLEYLLFGVELLKILLMIMRTLGWDPRTDNNHGAAQLET